MQICQRCYMKYFRKVDLKSVSMAKLPLMVTNNYLDPDPITINSGFYMVLSYAAFCMALY